MVETYRNLNCSGASPRCDSLQNLQVESKRKRQERQCEHNILRQSMIEFFRGASEGAITLLHLSKCSRPIFQSVKSTLSDLKTCHPMRGTPWSTAWTKLIGTGRIRFRKKTVSNNELSEFSCPHRVPGRELSEFLSVYYMCDKANSLSFSQNSPCLPQNSVRLSEFSPPHQHSRNSIPPVS